MKIEKIKFDPNSDHDPLICAVYKNWTAYDIIVVNINQLACNLLFLTKQIKIVSKI